MELSVPPLPHAERPSLDNAGQWFLMYVPSAIRQISEKYEDSGGMMSDLGLDAVKIITTIFYI